MLDLTATLARGGVRVTLITGDAADAPKEWRAGDAAGLPRIVEIDRTLSPLARKRADVEQLRRLVSEADVVHLHTLWDPFNRVVSGAAERVGTPWVITAHGMLDDGCMVSKPRKKQIYLALGGRRWIERAARVHFTSEVERDQSRPRAPGLRPAVLPLVADLPPLDTVPGPEAGREAAPAAFASGEPVVMFLGRLHPIKGLDGLIDAFARVTGDGPAARLLLVGPVDPAFHAELDRQVERRGVADRVHFVGMVHGDVKFSLYRACDLYVLPSHHENFGMALVEAMACGAAALTTRSVNIWPELQQYGATICDDSVDGLEGGLRSCLADLDDAKARAESGRDPLREWLEPDRVGERYAELYREVVAETTGNA